MAQIGDEVDIVLAGTGEVQHGKALLAADVGEKLLESPARTRSYDFLLNLPGARFVIVSTKRPGTRGQRSSWTTEHAHESVRNQLRSPLAQTSASPRRQRPQSACDPSQGSTRFAVEAAAVVQVT